MDKLAIVNFDNLTVTILTIDDVEEIYINGEDYSMLPWEYSIEVEEKIIESKTSRISSTDTKRRPPSAAWEFKKPRKVSYYKAHKKTGRGGNKYWPNGLCLSNNKS